MAVDTKSKQYLAMAEQGSWDLLQTLLGGTPAMRAAGTKFTPKEPDEKQKNYNVRIKRSFLHNAYDETIEKYVARPFSRPATWDVLNNPEAKEKIEPVMMDMDGEGMTHQEFAKEYFRVLMRWGVASAYTDYSKVENPEGETADSMSRPINSVFATPNVIGWKADRQTNGVETLTEVRIRETYIEDLADWEQQVYEQIRVIRVDSYQVWRREKRKSGSTFSKSAEWGIVDKASGSISMNGSTPAYIPLVTMYTKKLGLLTALPPFLNLGWTNLELWQSMSDQKNILRFDRLGILFGAGFSEAQVKAGILISPTNSILTENPDANLNRVETNGKPAENGWKDIRDIMERLEIQGMDPMIQRLANVKATGIAANEDKSRSQIESWIDAANTAMRKVIQNNLLWLGYDVPLEDIQYNIYQDFVFATKTSQEVKDVIEMRKNGDLALEDFIKEMQRYGRLADGDVTELANRARADQAPGLGFLSGNTAEGGGTGAQPRPLGAAAVANAAQGQPQTTETVGL